jgi:UDP-N-acetylglucosamine 2-epimerase
MAQLFFVELGIPEPQVNLGVGSANDGQQLARMLERLEPVLSGGKPDWVVVYGDTNSTLAGALMRRV